MPLDGTHEHGAGAVLFAKAYLIESVGHAQRRRHAGPAQALIRLAPNISEPAVPALVQRHFDPGTVRHRLDEDRVVQHLDVDAVAVHVREAEIDVAHLARLLVVCELPPRSLGELFQLSRGERREAQSPHLAVDQPKLQFDAGLFAGFQRHRPILFFRSVQVIPGVSGFDNMGVGVDDFHRNLPFTESEPAGAVGALTRKNLVFYCLRSSLSLKFFIDRFDKSVGFQSAHDRRVEEGFGLFFFQAGSVSAIMSSVMRAISNAQSRQTA